MPLIDKQGKTVEFQVYGINQISTEVKEMNVEGVLHLFDDLTAVDVKRPIGEIIVLIGFEYAGFHPVREQFSGHLLLLSNRFDKCLGGSRPNLCEGTQHIVKHIIIHHFRRVIIQDVYYTEVMGVNVGSAHWDGKNYTLKEEHELKLIEVGLKHMGNHWIARYPGFAMHQGCQITRELLSVNLKV